MISATSFFIAWVVTFFVMRFLLNLGDKGERPAGRDHRAL